MNEEIYTLSSVLSSPRLQQAFMRNPSAIKDPIVADVCRYELSLRYVENRLEEQERLDFEKFFSLDATTRTIVEYIRNVRNAPA